MSTTIGILDFYRLDVSTRDSNSVIEIPWFVWNTDKLEKNSDINQ